MKKTYSRTPRPGTGLQEKIPQQYLLSCRLCLSKEINTNLNIFKDDELLPFSAKIKYCLGLEVLEGDGLPTSLCEQCSNRLIEYYNFKKSCLETDFKLQQFHKLSNTSSLKHTLLTLEPNGQDLNSSVANSAPGCDEANINLLEVNCLDHGREKCLLEEDYLHPDAPDLISQIKKEFQPESLLNEVPIFDSLPIEKVEVTAPRKESSFKCKECNEEYGTILETVLHEEQAHSSRKYHCSHCWKSFVNKTLIEKHMRVHSGVKPFECKTCGKRFTQKDTLARHSKSHDPNSQFTCSLCSKHLLTYDGLKCHITTHHTVREPHELYKYKCKFCVKAFCHSSGLSRHLLSHSGVFYTCEHCYKSFCDSSSLRRHVSLKHMNKFQEKIRSKNVNAEIA